MNKEAHTPKSSTKIATFGAGCFWCVEAIYDSIEGVLNVKPGYMGGDLENPTYEQIATGTTGHAEVIQIEYNESVVSFAQLIVVLFETHDPTTLNQQGADKGTQYRSVIFYHDDYQKMFAEKAKLAAQGSANWKDPIVTEISPASTFYEAENYHHDYFENNPDASYCSFVVRPKLEKFKKNFEHLLKV